MCQPGRLRILLYNNVLLMSFTFNLIIFCMKEKGKKDKKNTFLNIGNSVDIVADVDVQ